MVTSKDISKFDLATLEELVSARIRELLHSDENDYFDNKEFYNSKLYYFCRLYKTLKKLSK